MLHIVWVHGADLLPSRGSKNLDDFHQLVNSRLSREQWLTKHEFSHHTTRGPHVLTIVSMTVPNLKEESVKTYRSLLCN